MSSSLTEEFAELVSRRLIQNESHHLTEFLKLCNEDELRILLETYRQEFSTFGGIKKSRTVGLDLILLELALRKEVPKISIWKKLKNKVKRCFNNGEEKG